jgi:uncharacterized membrane protein (UPF0182 family)
MQIHQSTRTMRPANNRKRILWMLIAAAIFGLFSISGAIVTLFTDYFWFKELGLSRIFATTLTTKIGLGIGFGLIGWLFIAANIFVAEYMSSRTTRFTGLIDTPLMQLFKLLPLLRVLLAVASLLAALMLGSWASSLWEQYITFRNAVPFGVRDPLFNKDIAFFVFKLPFFRLAFGWSIALLVFGAIGAAFVYLTRQNIAFDGKSFKIAKLSRVHLLILAGFACLAIAVSFQFKMYSLLTAVGTIVNGAGYAQVAVSLPILKVMRFIAILAGLLCWLSAFGRSSKLLYAAGVLLILGVVSNKAVTQTVQKFVVGPDELTKEAPYIRWSIAATRAAYELDKVQTSHFVPADQLNAGALEANSATVDNIRLWDHAPLLTTFSQLQEIRTYYEFVDVDNDRYTIDGQYRQVMLSPRELVPASLPSRTWLNEHLTYTHGYGLCLGPVNSVTPEGLPDFFIKNIPPASTISTQITRPQIYYGEADAGYAIVKTGAKEFDYPSGNENVYTDYNGTGGIPMGGLLKKALFAMRFNELKILLRSDITPQSRIMINRQILARMKSAVPFLTFDKDPYMVITAQGRLVWMVDGYTSTAAYPYSAPVQGMGNYIRNSVKAIVDAYDGSIALFVADSADPIIATYSAAFPGVFKPLSAMPADLRSHVRYPQTLFKIQAHVYAIYHMTDPQVFYNKEDVWKIPDSFSEGQSGPMSPYYTIMKLAEVGRKEEFILLVPFCPSKKENMIAWLAARCDQPNYGSLLVFDFPKQKLVYGPSQIESRINQDPEISKQLTLWNQGGSRVIRGSLLVIPVDQSLIYVQPLYLSSQSGGVPELKRVIVAYENNIAMEPTLAASLQQIFGQAAAHLTVTDTNGTAAPLPAALPAIAGLKNLIAEANRQFELGQQELHRSNWAGYGEAMEQVRKLLGELGKSAENR